jgi:hypothetical protein
LPPPRQSRGISPQNQDLFVNGDWVLLQPANGAAPTSLPPVARALNLLCVKGGSGIGVTPVTTKFQKKRNRFDQQNDKGRQDACSRGQFLRKRNELATSKQ